jgi:transposase
MQKAQVTVPLGIPDVKVIKAEFNKIGELIIAIESTKPDTTCHRCGRTIDKFHGYDNWVTIRYLPVFGRPAYLRYQPKRYSCVDCHCTTTQYVDWHESNSPHAIAYDDHILLQLVNSTVEDVSMKEGLSYDGVLGTLERRICSEVDWRRFESLEELGLDEIALKKGHRDFVVIITARSLRGQIAILGVLGNREKETVVAFLRSIPMRLLRTVHTVCCDMYEGFTEAARQEIQSVCIVVDRFHVTIKYREAADNLRKQELKRLKQELDDEAYKQLKGSMWAFRRKRADLKPEERKVLKLLFAYSQQLKLAYNFQEQLTAIFDQNISKSVAKIKIRAWIKRVQKSGLSCFDEFLKTLIHWWEEITNYFIHRASSGFVEGLNNKIKVLKRRCYGIFNLKHLFQRIFLDLEGYTLFARIPPYLA